MQGDQKNIENIIGVGWSFPPTFDHKTSTIEMTAGRTDIEQSLEIIITTRLGERVMRPEFGCALDQYVFDPMSTSQQSFIKELIKTAILYHEPRIDLNELNLEITLDGYLNILLVYTIRATNSRFNFVFPYYINENANI